MASPNSSGTNYLVDVEGSLPNDVWTVGYHGAVGQLRTLAEHWDGSAWSVVASPNAASGNNSFAGVAAIKPDDAWAAGHVDPAGGGATKTILAHWDGSAWTLASYSVPGTLLGIEAVATNDVWAVGYAGSFGSYTTLILHWNGTAWSTVASPNGGAGNNYLNRLAVHDQGDIWAVGEREPAGGGATQTLALHWNGATWTASAGQISGVLQDVAFAGANDVWAVGYNGSVGSLHTLTRHWNGVAWTTVASPDAGAGNNSLAAITVLDSGDIWAAGHIDPSGGGATTTILEHWNGSVWTLDAHSVPGTLLGLTHTFGGELWDAGYNGNFGAYQTLIERSLPCPRVWSQVASPNSNGSNYLLDVQGSQPNDIWAVGYHGAAGQLRTLAEHWDGSAWSVVASPNAASGNNSFAGVAAIAPNDAWAAGHVDPAGGGATKTILAHWDGTTWTRSSYSVGGTLLGIAAVASNNVWAVGYTGSFGSYTTLILHWNGTAWSMVASPSGSGNNYLNHVAVGSANDIWAVGNIEAPGGGATQTLALHWNGATWTASAGQTPGVLQGVAVAGDGQVWAVGYRGAAGSFTPLVRHWNGTSWSNVASASAGAGNNSLAAVTILANGEIWAAGHIDPSGGGLTKTILEHFNGSAFVRDPHSVAGTLLGLTHTATGELWDVGYNGTFGAYHTLIEHAP